MLIDTVGALALASCIAACFWLAAIQGDRTATETRQLQAAIETARADLTTVRSACQRQEAVLAAHQQTREITGNLPSVAPVEAYFQTLSALATANNLRVVSQHPVASQVYPGLVEARFAYEVVGGTQDIVAFMRAVEQTDFWADVSYLQIGGAAIGPGTPSAGQLGTYALERQAAFTLSLFSAAAPGETG